MPLQRQSMLNTINVLIYKEEVAEDAKKHLWMTFSLAKYLFPGNRNGVSVSFMTENKVRGLVNVRLLPKPS